MHKHIICECGGVIGSYDKGNSCMCERCKKKYRFHELEYDVVQINHETGWMFPMKTLKNK